MAGNSMAPRFTIGRTLGDSIKIFGRNIVAFALVALAIRLLLLLVPDGQAASVMTSATQINWFNAILSMLVAIVVGSATKAVVVFPTMQNMRGQRATISDLWRIVPFLPAIMLAGLILSLPSFVSLIIQGLFPGNAAVLGVSGFVMGVLVLVFLLMWWLYAPTIALEKGGVLQGLKRSHYLVSGQRWRVFGLLIILGLASAVAVITIALLGGLSFSDLSSLAYIRSMTPVSIAVFVFSALIGAFDGVLVTVAYYHLRVEKEGAIAEDLIQVFD